MDRYERWKGERWKAGGKIGKHLKKKKKNNPSVAPYILYVDEKNEELIEEKNNCIFENTAQKGKIKFLIVKNGIIWQ